MNVLRRLVWVFALVAFPFAAVSMQACPFCDGEKGPTMTLQFEEAAMVIYGHFENPRTTGDFGGGESDLVFEAVLKPHDAIKGLKKITLPKHIADSKLKFVVFCDVYKGKIDAYKGTQVSDASEMRRDIDDILKNQDKSQPERLRVAFDYLNSPEIEVAMDAYREFARAPYSDYQNMAKTLPADKIAGWLQDPKTPAYRYGLYASLLGHCGNEKHAAILFEMINDPEKRKVSGLHGLMAAYTMLEPKKGWSFLTELVQDKEKPFLVRYSGLQTMRFLWDNRLDLISKDEKIAKTTVVKGVANVLAVSDMADFAVEDLRKWQRWDHCDQVLDIFGKKGFTTPIIRKSILRYALQCPSPRAVAFVKAQEALEREWVQETRELLNLETAPPPTPAKKDTPAKK
ncbi:MAG TPA: hypothetical protein VFE62_28910 [Gemmataceae bacterium]|nr:hypothetical protein [Gemmataceae bacterium]